MADPQIQLWEESEGPGVGFELTIVPVACRLFKHRKGTTTGPILGQRLAWGCEHKVVS